MKLGKYLSSLTKPELEELILKCNFTEDEEIVFRNLSKGWTLSRIEVECNMSESTILRKMDKINVKVNKIKECDEVKKDVPISEKFNLTVDEAAAYFNIGTDKIREITNENKHLTIMVGVKKLIKKKKMEEYLDGIMVL